MPHCKYLNKVISESSSASVTQDGLIRFLMAEVRKILSDSSFTDYKRVQLLNIYFGYLSTLTGIKGDYKLQVCLDEFQRLSQCLRLGKDETISWLLVEFKDVQDREKECAAFLQKSDDIVDQVQRCLFSRALWAMMGKQKVMFIGSVKIQSKNVINYVDPTAKYGEIYALRLDDNTYKFRHILTKEGDRTFLKRGEAALVPGEPLFVFSANNRITSLPEELETLEQIFTVAKKKDMRNAYPFSWPVGLDVK